MRKGTYTAICQIAVIALFSLAAFGSAYEGQVEGDEMVLKIMQNEDTNDVGLAYSDLLSMALVQYGEDFTCSSDILLNFTNGTITSLEAMSAGTSLVVLTQQSIDMINQFEPPEEYLNCYNYTLLSLEYLKSYVFYLSKFYETSNSRYIILAKEYLDLSGEYYEKAIEESYFVE